jgi:hypothetical protein
MLAVALIAAGVIGLVVANARSQRESTEGNSNSQSNTAKSGSREDVKHKPPVSENVTSTLKPAAAPVQTVRAEAAPSARLIGTKSSNGDNATLSTDAETARTETPGSLGGGTWRWPAASNAPAALTPDRPCVPPAGKPSGEPSAAINTIPNMPNYQQPESMLLQSEMPGATEAGLNGAAFRGSIDKLPSNVTR